MYYITSRHIGRAIKFFRLNKKLSAKELSLLSSCGQNYITRVERCVTHANVDKLIDISRILNINLSILIEKAEAFYQEDEEKEWMKYGNH